VHHVTRTKHIKNTGAFQHSNGNSFLPYQHEHHHQHQHQNKNQSQTYTNTYSSKQERKPLIHNKPEPNRQDYVFEFLKYKYKNNSDSASTSTFYTPGFSNTSNKNTFHRPRRKSTLDTYNSNANSDSNSISSTSDLLSSSHHYYSYGTTNHTVAENPAFIIEIKPPTPTRAEIDTGDTESSCKSTYTDKRTRTNAEKMRQVEMQRMLNKNNDNDNDDKNHNKRKQASSLMQEIPQEYNNHLTWPKLKRASTTLPFDMNLSPLASLFPQHTRKERRHSLSDMNDAQQFIDVDAQNQFDAFLSTLDRFEDDFDQQAYEELIPLNIRMALENQIFGWDHLYSAALGHVLLPLTAYMIIYWCVTLIGLRGINCPKRYTWNCTVHKFYQFEEYEFDYQPMFGISMAFFGFIRIVLALWSALSTFRTIRRRRKVWLHHQATEYFRRDTIAHLNMEQADRETLLGRIRSKVNRKKNSYLERRMLRKIRKATGRFETRERRRRDFKDGAMEYEGDHHRRVQVLSQRGGATRRVDHEEEDSIASTPSNDREQESSNDREQESIISDGREDKTEDLDANEFFDTYQKYKRTAKEEYERDHDGDMSAKHFYGHTMPAFAMQSIAQDQIKFQNGPIQNVAYAHGGFFGAAPFMLANPHWIHILRQLMPDVYVEISRRVVHTPVPQLIHWAENNPVVAAYGTAHDLEYFGKVPTLEWDVFLDPHLVQRVEVVLEARDSFLQGLAEKSKRIRTALNHKREERRYTSKMVKISALLESEDEKKILHFYNAEIDKRVMLLVEHMLIAHGNLSQLSLEQTGYLKHFNFSRVKHTRRTLGGGIYAKHWIMTYAEALKMSTELDEDISNDDGMPTSMSSTPITESHHSSLPSPALRNDESDENLEANDQGLTSSTLSFRRRPSNNGSPPREQTASATSSMRSSPVSPKKGENSLKPSTSFQDLAMAAVTTSSIEESMNSLKKLMNCEAPLGLVLDVKSRHVPKRVWALVLDCLRDMGARVEGIATFYQEDIRDITKYCAAPTKEIMFFHSAGDLQKACHDGRIRRGDSVFFNAGSLFWNYPVLNEKDFLIKVIRNVCTTKFDAKEYKEQYRFQPYARVATGKDSNHSAVEGDQFAETDALVQPLMRVQRAQDTYFKYFEGTSSTVQQYKEQFDLSIGLYVQEFAIDEKSMELLVQYANRYSDVYDLGFSWGGVNGVTVRGIQPGRFTNTDGFWNQRYCGERWNENLFPGRLA